MKGKYNRIILLAAFIASMSVSNVSAVKYESPVKKLYEKWDGEAGVEVVYMTKKMLELRFNKVTQGKYSEEWSGVVDNFYELVMISFDKNSLVTENEIKTLLKSIKNNDNYEQIVKMSDGGESIEVYIMENKSNSKILDMVFVAIDNGEKIFLSITGELTFAEIALLSNIVDINILGILNM